MNRRVWSVGILLAVFGLVCIGIQGSNAEPGEQTGQVGRRTRTVEIRVTQYVWRLVSNRDGRLICEVIVEHTGRPTNEEAIQICAEQIFPQEPLPTPFWTVTPGTVPVSTPTPGPPPSPFDLAEFFRSVSWVFVTSRDLVRTAQVPVPDMIVNLVVPPNQSGPFFASIYAYEPVMGEQITAIRGTLNGWPFICRAARCDVPIPGDAVLEFWAESSYGDESQHSQATFRRTLTDAGERIELASLTPIVLFQDACAAIWDLPRTDFPSWASLPALPDDLNTMKPYQYLAGKLLAAGVVRAPDCPGGGFASNGGPNTCGLERASQAVIEWQNQYDLVLWQAGREAGIPPILLKVLIEQESQFWPGNARTYLFEYGLAQMNQMGADVVFRWDNELFNTICNGLLYDCSTAYGRLPSWLQATVRGGLMRALDAECPTCLYGINLTRARETIPTIARVLRANCQQVNYLLDFSGLEASYDDLWRLTFVSFHSGYDCVSQALGRASFNEVDASWENISQFLTCPGSRTYIENFWSSLESFETYRIRRADASRPVSQPTFSATPAPTLTPTPVRALSHIRVVVYVDSNGNQTPEPGELVDQIPVEVRFPDGSVTTAQTANGEAVIDLTGRPVGIDVTVTLPDLFRTQRVRIMQDGEIPVVFRLEEPVVPPALP